MPVLTVVNDDNPQGGSPSDEIMREGAHWMPAAA